MSKRPTSLGAVGDWLLLLLVILMGLSILWALANRSFIGDVEMVLTAVLQSGEPVQAYPPCLTEAALGPCYWDAETMGNDTGRSFTIDTLGRVHYWDEEN